MTRGGYSGGYTPVDTLRSNTLKMSHHNHGGLHGGGGNYNSNYEYYDNTTAVESGLYGTSTKKRTVAAYQTTPIKSSNLKAAAVVAASSYDAYEYELQREYEYEDEKAMCGDDDEDEDNGHVGYDDHGLREEETESMSSSRSEKNTNSTSGNEESTSGGGGSGGHELMTPTYTPAPPLPNTVVASKPPIGYNVSGSIGSGVESIKKHTYGLTSGKFKKK